MNLVDTSGWLAYFFDDANASYFADPIENTGELLVSTVCLYEVFKKINLVAGEAQALQAIAQMRRGKVVDLSEDIALSAAFVSIRYKLPMADSMIYATAKAHRATVWTQDADFKDLPNVNFRKS